MSEIYTVLPGAVNDSGGRYEYLMASFVALKCLQDSTITDFKISNNNKTFGKFDDLVVETTSEHGKEHTWALQLKHSQRGKVVSKNELAAAGGGDFSVQKYFEDYIERKQQRDYSETTMILYTNRRLDEEKKFEIVGKRGYIFKTSKISSTSLFDTSPPGNNCSIYQFGIEVKHEHEQDRNEVEEYRQFFSKFFLYSNQSDADGIEGEISKLFNVMYKSNVEDKYKKYFEEWCRIAGRREKLVKTKIEMELRKILLEQHVVAIAQTKSGDRGEMLKRAIANFNVTVLPEECRDLIGNLWDISDSQQDWSGISSGDLPLVVNVDVDNQHAIYSAIDLCPDPKFVLIGDCIDFAKLKHLKVFKNLCDLQGKCYSKIVANFSCVIQGRNETQLDQILNENEHLNRYFGVGELFKMVDKRPLVIGDDTAPLPEYYIKRSIPQPSVFNLDLVTSLRNDVLVIACNDGSDWDAVQNAKNGPTRILRKKDNDFESNLKDPKLNEMPLIIQLKKTCCIEEFDEICKHFNTSKSVHHFQFDNKQLVWIRTRGVIKYLKTFPTVISNETIADSNFLQYFTNNINVILADPGMGKSVFGNFLKRISKFDHWPLLINLREKVSIFRCHSKDLVERVLNAVPNKSAEKLRTIFKENRKFVFIWDGLDEVETGDVQTILHGIKEISDQGYSQWITSRVHLKETLEDFFGILSIALTEVTPEDQKKYIKENLSKTYKHTIIENVTCNIIEHIDKSKLRNMLGTPLLLYMYTQICLDESKYDQMLNSELNLTGIYDMFVDGKFNHFNEKIAKERNTLFSKAQKVFKKALLRDYQKAALKTCFDKSIFEKLNLDCDDFLEDMKSGDVLGIITNVTDNTATFMHKTLAEYFSARFLANHFQRLSREILQLLFQEEYKPIRLFFDMCLAENCPAHLAILELNMDKLQNNLNDILRKDKGGRNGLHIACSYGVTRPPLVLKRITSKKKYKIFDELPLEYKVDENINYANIIKVLISHVDGDEECITDKDEVFGMNCLQYADISLSLFPILQIFASKPKLYKEPDEVFFKYKDIESIIAYAVIYNHENFISILNCVPYFEYSMIYFETFNFPRYYLPPDGVNCNILMLMMFFDRPHMLKKALENKNNIQMINLRYGENNLIGWAVEKGNLEMVKLLIHHPIKTTQPYGFLKHNSILHEAVQGNKIDIVKYFVSINLVKINKCNADKDTPLLIASRVGNFAIAKFLISHGAYVYAQNKDGYNILHLACLGKHLEFIENLPRKFLIGLDQADNNGDTPLLLAAREGNYNIYKHLMDNGANIDAKNSKGYNSLHCAIAAFHGLQFIEKMTRENVIRFHNDGDNDGNTPLLLAAKVGKYETFEHLLNNGANINARNSSGYNIMHLACVSKHLRFSKRLIKICFVKIDGVFYNLNSPLQLAARSGNYNICEHYFMEKGANVDAQNSKEHIVVICAYYGEIKFIKKIIRENVINFDNVDNDGNTPLLLAASFGNFGICRSLLHHGANINARNSRGHNVLHLACANEHLIFVRSLPRKDLIRLDEADNNGYTPLLLAARKGSFMIHKHLMDNGANVDAKNSEGHNILHCALYGGLFIKEMTREDVIKFDTGDNDGNTPLLLAACLGRFEIFKQLLDNGANINARNSRGYNILHLACGNQNTEFFEKLTSKLNVLDTFAKIATFSDERAIDIAKRHKRTDIINYLQPNVL